MVCVFSFHLGWKKLAYHKVAALEAFLVKVWVAGRMLDISELRLTQPSLVELGLGLIARIIWKATPCAWSYKTSLNKNGFCQDI